MSARARAEVGDGERKEVEDGERGTGGIGDEIMGVKCGVDGVSMESTRCGGVATGGAEADEWRLKRLMKSIFGSRTDWRGEGERKAILRDL